MSICSSPLALVAPSPALGVGPFGPSAFVPAGPPPEIKLSRFDPRLIGVSAAGFCVFLSVYATQALLPMLAGVFHASAMHASMTVTATTAAVALGAPAIGLLAERVGRKIVIVTAIFTLAAPTLLAATAGGLNSLIAWRFVQGLIMPGIIAVTMAYVAEEWPPGRIGAAMSAYVTGNVLGGVAGRLMSGWIAAKFGWNYAFIALGLIDLAGGALVLSTLPPARKAARAGTLSTSLLEMARHLGNRKLLAAFACGFNILLALVAAFTYVTFHLASPAFGLGPAALGSLFLVYLVGVVVTPIGGRFIDHRGQRHAMLVALGLATAGILLTLVPSLLAVMAGLSLCSSGIFVCQTATASHMGLVAGKARASASGLYASFYYAGGAAGAFIPGLFWKLGGWPATVGFIVVVLMVTAAIVGKLWNSVPFIRCSGPS
jgi:YNFM family putative membrane transporter